MNLVIRKIIMVFSIVMLLSSCKSNYATNNFPEAKSPSTILDAIESGELSEPTTLSEIKIDTIFFADHYFERSDLQGLSFYSKEKETTTENLIADLQNPVTYAAFVHAGIIGELIDRTKNVIRYAPDSWGGYTNTSTSITVPNETTTSINVQNYSDDEILSFVINNAGLVSTTVKLEDFLDTDPGREQLEDPIHFALVELRPDRESNEIDRRDYYRIYFGQHFGDHNVRYLRIFVKYDLSEIVLSQPGYFDEPTEVIYPK